MSNGNEGGRHIEEVRKQEEEFYACNMLSVSDTFTQYAVQRYQIAANQAPSDSKIIVS